MKQCKLTITSAVDGEENSVLRVGEMQLSPLSAQITYREEEAIVHLRLQNNRAWIEREGDYKLFLPLEQDKLCKGSIGILGTEGNVEVFTHKIAYSIGKDSLLLSLQYQLIFGEEKQEMKLRILSRFYG